MASSNRYQKQRASVAPDTKLPPITETPPASSPTSQSSKGSKSRSDNDNPFRRNSRRPSLALSSSSSSSRDSTTSPTSRRSSLNAPGRNSIDLSKSENIIKQVEKQRRGSVLNVMPNGRRASFRTLGARVTTLLKAKNAFARLKNRQGIVTDEDEDDSKVFEIDKMPHTPRFASTLSAEAQYAMMKGYEDVVYSNICNQYPEYRPMLRRNRTPHSGITVSPPKRKDAHHRLLETCTVSGKLEDVVDGKSDDASVSQMESEPPTTSTPTPEDKSDQTPRDTLTTSPVPRSLSNISHSPREKENTSPCMRSASKHKHVKRHVDRPDKEQQLVMTYRYQRAMDILDNIRMHQGWHALSPRMKAEHRIEPLKEYNSWSYVWNHEFVPKPGVANM